MLVKSKDHSLSSTYFRRRSLFGTNSGSSRLQEPSPSLVYMVDADPKFHAGQTLVDCLGRFFSYTIMLRLLKKAKQIFAVLDHFLDRLIRVRTEHGPVQHPHEHIGAIARDEDVQILQMIFRDEPMFCVPGEELLAYERLLSRPLPGTQGIGEVPQVVRETAVVEIDGPCPSPIA